MYLDSGPQLDGASLYQLLEDEKCTLSAAVPTVFIGLLQYLRDTNQRLTHLKCITIGGAACPALLLEAFQDEYGVEMRHMWGEHHPTGPMYTSVCRNVLM